MRRVLAVGRILRPPASVLTFPPGLDLPWDVDSFTVTQAVMIHETDPGEVGVSTFTHVKRP